jgi:hypothetical protein
MAIGSNPLSSTRKSTQAAAGSPVGKILRHFKALGRMLRVCDVAGAVQSLMSGYYQNSVMFQRDLVEVTFFLNSAS